VNRKRVERIWWREGLKVPRRQPKTDVAHRHGIAPQQLTTWRRAARQGRLALPEDPVAEEACTRIQRFCGNLG
jgi:transposase-like protein